MGSGARADDLAVPAPRLGVDRLAHRAEQPDRGEVELLRDVAAPLHEGADRGRRGVEDRHLEVLDDPPPAALVRGALVHHLRAAVGQRAVDDVAVAGDPADVGGAPVDVVVLDVEHRPVGVGREQQVAAGGVQHALGLPGGAGGVEDEQRVLAVVQLRLVLGRGAVDDLVPPQITVVVPVHVLAGTTHHHDLLHRLALVRSLVAGLVDRGLERRRGTAAVAAVGGDDHVRLAVDHARGEGLGGEAAEDDRVDRADAGAGQHRDGGLGDHRQVDRDGVALADAQVGERVGGPADTRSVSSAYVMSRVSTGLSSPSSGSPTKWIATLSPLPAATWRSTQLCDTLRVPSANHFANGGFDQSRISVNGLVQVELLGLLGPVPLGVFGCAQVHLGGALVRLFAKLRGRGVALSGVVREGRKTFDSAVIVAHGYPFNLKTSLSRLMLDPGASPTGPPKEGMAADRPQRHAGPRGMDAGQLYLGA